MSLLKPVISSIANFDATQNYTLNFQIDSNSDQCFGNRIIIQNNSTSTVVYDNIVTSFLLQHLIPQNTLVNGIIYKITIAYFNLSGTYSSFSDGTIFKCLATPITTISNITTNQIVASNSYNFTGTWIQADGDTLQSYEYYLYDGNGTLLQSSATLFYAPSNVIEYQFSAFTNNTVYGVQLKTLSSSGVEVDTGIIYFTVQYIAPTFTGNLSLTNLPTQGGVQVLSNVLQIIGQIGSGSIAYQSSDFVDLRNGMVYFDTTHGMSAFSNFTLRIFVKNIISDTPFLTLVSPQGTISICWQSWNGCINATKTITNGLSKYNIFGQSVSLTTSNTVFIFLQQINNYMNIQYEILS